jgi:hypothetical protein
MEYQIRRSEIELKLRVLLDEVPSYEILFTSGLFKIFDRYEKLNDRLSYFYAGGGLLGFSSYFAGLNDSPQLGFTGLGLMGLTYFSKSILDDKLDKAGQKDCYRFIKELTDYLSEKKI